MTLNHIEVQPTSPSVPGFALGISTLLTLDELKGLLVKYGMEEEDGGLYVDAPENIEAALMDRLMDNVNGMGDGGVLRFMDLLDILAGYDDEEIGDWPIAHRLVITSRNVPSLAENGAVANGFWVNPHGITGLLVDIYLTVRIFGECAITLHPANDHEEEEHDDKIAMQEDGTGQDATESK